MAKSSKTKEVNVNDAMEPILSAPPKVKKIIKQVLELENEKLYQDKPQVKAEIMKIVKDVVK